VAGVRIGKHTIQFNLCNKRNKFQWALLVLYGPPYVELKDEFLAELSSCCNIIYIFGGYFNILRHIGEKNKACSLAHSFDNFNSIKHI
jgi:hypothetical protein